MIRIPGTGLSGSVSGINPPVTQFFVGECRYAFGYDVTSTCTSPARVMTYTTSGELTPGLIAYSDRYGVNPILGLTFVTGQSGGAIYSMNTSTGQIGAETGYFC